MGFLYASVIGSGHKTLRKASKLSVTTDSFYNDLKLNEDYEVVAGKYFEWFYGHIYRFLFSGGELYI